MRGLPTERSVTSPNVSGLRRQPVVLLSDDSLSQQIEMCSHVSEFSEAPPTPPQPRAFVDLGSDNTFTSAIHLARSRAAFDSNKRKSGGGGDGQNGGDNPIPGAGGPSTGRSQRPRKERQPNWEPGEIMALIRAKGEEHERYRIAEDDRELMESGVVRWTKIATIVQSASISNFFRGHNACKEKWATMYSDYKKLKDYRKATGNNEDYFKMISKRRKQLTLPVNFASIHFNEMDKFLYQRPIQNPPHQRDTMDEDDHVLLQPEHLDDLEEHEDPNDFMDEDNRDPTLTHGPEFLSHHGSFALKQRMAAAATYNNIAGPSTVNLGGKMKEPMPAKENVTGKEKMKASADEAVTPEQFNTTPRPASTEVKRRQSSSQIKMVEVTESQGKEIVTNMEKLSKIEHQKMVDHGLITARMLDYMKTRDVETSRNQKGLVKAIQSSSDVMGAALGQHFGPRQRLRRRVPTPYPNSPIGSDRQPSPFGKDIDITLTPSPAHSLGGNNDVEYESNDEDSLMQKNIAVNIATEEEFELLKQDDIPDTAK